MKTPLSLTPREEAAVKAQVARLARDEAIADLSRAAEAHRTATARFRSAEEAFVAACDELIVARNQESSHE